MGSKPSKTNRVIPQDVIDEILDCLASDRKSLRKCALVAKSWIPSCRRHLFRAIVFTPKSRTRWLETFPVPEESPARHVRSIYLSGTRDITPGRLLEHSPWFTNVEKVTLCGDGVFQLPWMHFFGRLARSVTSLTMDHLTVPLVYIREVIMRLPNLNDLSLSGRVETMDRSTVPGMGTVLRGRFGGELRLLGGLAHEDVINMLLEVPSGLHFTEVEIRSPRRESLPIARLLEACGKSLVKLSYTVSLHCKSHSFSDGLVLLTPRCLQTHMTWILPNSRTSEKWTLGSGGWAEVWPGSLPHFQPSNLPPLHVYPPFDSTSSAHLPPTDQSKT